MNIINVKNNPEYLEQAINYFQEKWAGPTTMNLYEDCIKHSLNQNAVPNWYLLLDGKKIIGCVGLITNDFISRMDLFPWLVALFIEEEYRGKRLSEKLIEKVKEDVLKGGYENLYLATDHIGFYEKFGFTYKANGYHPWGEVSRIYEIKV
ncbi:MAG: GNAT family N-acetyltransferase [Streptococcaceae bacterium]|jgi:GNAT superfamily N-acetyltransferase|nr:GNAT family N-acetyltransferase [Streptococcaceae bacterium]